MPTDIDSKMLEKLLETKTKEISIEEMKFTFSILIDRKDIMKINPK